MLTLTATEVRVGDSVRYGFSSGYVKVKAVEQLPADGDIVFTLTHPYDGDYPLRVPRWWPMEVLK